MCDYNDGDARSRNEQHVSVCRAFGFMEMKSPILMCQNNAIEMRPCCRSQNRYYVHWVGNRTRQDRVVFLICYRFLLFVNFVTSFAVVSFPFLGLAFGAPRIVLTFLIFDRQTDPSNEALPDFMGTDADICHQNMTTHDRRRSVNTVEVPVPWH
uniref:Uncharacterized protein n=1 Tax=Glossina austeni TaxID=7395 RepID=A0A1A9UPQ7_GLOAU